MALGEMIAGASILSGVGSFLGGQAAGEGASKGADATIEAARISTAESTRQFDIGQENLRPYQEAGAKGLAEYTSMLDQDTMPRWQGFGAAEFEKYKDPGYDFRVNEGLGALDRMYASSGKSYSGERGIGLQKYGQDMASQEFGAARGRAIQDYQFATSRNLSRLGQWASLAQSGQQAAGAMSNLGSQYASQITSINQNMASGLNTAYTNQGNATAAGISGITNAAAGGIQDYTFAKYAGIT